MLRLPGAWIWDFWLADDGDRYHLFFLFASRALQDERRRHRRASIGHAISDDLRNWVQVGDALTAADGPAFDDLATWTGSVVRGHDDRWWLFYTGVTLIDADSDLVARRKKSSRQDIERLLSAEQHRGVVFNQQNLDRI